MATLFNIIVLIIFVLLTGHHIQLLFNLFIPYKKTCVNNGIFSKLFMVFEFSITYA